MKLTKKRKYLIARYFLLAMLFIAALTFYESGRIAGLTVTNGDYLYNLITKETSLASYHPSDLVDLKDLGAPGKQIRAVAYDHLAALTSDMRQNGLPILILSAFRTYQRQKSLFAYYSSKFKDAFRFSAPASHSEHQLGTTVDFGIGNKKVDLKEAFGQTPQGQWLLQHAWKYGFALSYPEGKEEVTGYQYEPWHYRFIGNEAAYEWHNSGLGLTEYLITKPQYYN